MGRFRTEVKVPRSHKPIRYDDNLLFIGSCFATNIGEYFEANCLNVLVNPFGVLYNPFSIGNSLERLLEGRLFTENDVLKKEGVYHSFYHHSQFNANDKQFFLETINTSFKESEVFIKKANTIVITFGTAWVYEHQETKLIVSNCHKYPSASFKRYRLSFDEIIERYHKLIEQIKCVNPKVEILLTISPVRHWKDGAHGNQLSKATLLLAVDKLVERFDYVNYFSAYELLLDDLRDYRFFADDMLHPSAAAIEYIRKVFIESQFDDKGKRVIEKIAQLNRAAEHRPFNIESDNHQVFVNKHIAKTDQLQQQYPTLDLSAIKMKFVNQQI